MVGQWAVQSMLMMSNSLLVYRLTGSGAIIGVVVLAQALPSLLLAFWGGTIADRIQKKYTLLFAQLALALVALVFAAVLYFGYVTPERWWLLLLLAVCQGSLLGFGTFISGMLSEVIGVQWAIGGMAMFLLFVSLGYLIFIRRVARLE